MRGLKAEYVVEEATPWLKGNPFRDSPVHRLRVARIAEHLRALGNAADVRVLEVGCGQGNIAAGLAALGYPVTAIDPHLPSVSAARDRYRLPGLEFAAVPVQELDITRFKAVVLSEVLEHVQDWRGLLQHLARSTPEHVHLIVTVPNGRGWTELLCRPSYALKKWPMGVRIVQGIKRLLKTRYLTTADEGTPHIHFFTFRKLIQGFGECGWRVESYDRMFFFWHCWEVFFSERRVPSSWPRRDFELAQRLPPALCASWLFDLTKSET